MKHWNLYFVRGRVEPSDLLLLHYDAGVGETAAVEGGKSAAEAGAAEGAAAEGAADVGAGATAADVGAGDALAAGAGDSAVGGGLSAGAGDATSTLGAFDATGAAAGADLPADLTALDSSALDTSTLGAFTPSGAAAGEDIPALSSSVNSSALGSSNIGLSDALKYGNAANNANNFAKDPSLQTGLGLAGSIAGIAGDAPSGAPGGLSSGGISPVGSSGLGAEDQALANFDASQAATPPTGSASPLSLSGDTGMSPADADKALSNFDASQGNGSLVDKALSALKGGTASQYLQGGSLGLAGLNMYNQSKAAGSAQKQLQSIAAPTSAVSNQLLEQFQSGQLNGADAYQIAQWQQQQTAQIDQYYAKAGLSNSSMHLQAKQQITQQAEAMRQQAVQSLLSGGLKAAGVSNPTLVAGVNAGVKQDEQSQLAMQNFINALAKMNSGQASAPAVTGTP